MKRQPWIATPAYDAAFILAPPFAALAVTAMLPAEHRSTDAMPLAAWVVLVLLIDVAHVWSTLYRTYLDPVRSAAMRRLFVAIPAAAYVVSVVVYACSPMLFWRCLAYLAVFHFIRQQYGFLRLYTRMESERSSFAKTLDAVTIYAATLYPLLWWHGTPGRNFNWFLEGDFWQFKSAAVLSIAGWVYAGILALYVASEAVTAVRERYVNWPKNALVAGTAISWYAGIVWLNGDVAFTMLNVVSHGIPYMALIWWTGRRERTAAPMRKHSRWWSVRWGWLAFVGILAALAWLEEGLWDGLVFHDHAAVFAPFAPLRSLDAKALFPLLVPLLSLPQLTHYVIDGFIWRKER